MDNIISRLAGVERNDTTAMCGVMKNASADSQSPVLAKDSESKTSWMNNTAYCVIQYHIDRIVDT